MLILSQKQVQKIIPLSKISQVIEAVEKGFAEYGMGKIQMPPKNYLFFPKHDGDLRIMPAFSPKLEMAGTKIVNVHPQNPKQGLKTVMAVVVLNDAKTGEPLALMDGTYLTGLRTGAASAIATKYLAKENANTLGVIGAGYQSIFQITAITKVRRIKEISVFDIKDEQVERLAEVLSKEDIEIKKANSTEEAAKKDILVTVTPAREPIIKRGWIQPGIHINAIGADAEGKQELESEILKNAKIVIDNWEQASHSGEINIPLEKGIINKENIHAQLSDIVAGQKQGRENDREITVFDSTGLAIQDLFTANLIFRKAKEDGIGEEIKIIE